MPTLELNKRGQKYEIENCAGKRVVFVKARVVDGEIVKYALYIFLEPTNVDGKSSLPFIRKPDLSEKDEASIPNIGIDVPQSGKLKVSIDMAVNIKKEEEFQIALLEYMIHETSDVQ